MNNGKKSIAAKPGNENNEHEAVKGLYEFMRQEGLVDLSVEDPESRITIKRFQRAAVSPVVHTMPQEMSASLVKETAAIEPGIFVTSPLIGTFYRASSPGEEPYVKEGEQIDAGNVMCIVEAMKVMNEIRAEKNCRVKKILAENGKPVTAGQNLFEIELP